MAFLVMFSTMSFTINMHYCGDRLVDTAFFHKAKGCGMEMDESIPVSGNSILKKGCCTETHITVKGQDELKLNSFDKLKFKQQVIISAFIVSFSNIFQNLPLQIVPHKDYSPPNLFADIQVLDQVFLI